MKEKVLVALDGSDGGKRALDAAVEHAKLSAADIVLTYVIEWSPYSFHTPEELEERHGRRESEIDRANSSVLEPLKEKLQDLGINVETIVQHGKIAETVVSIASDQDVSQIYIGRKGESSVRSMIFGTVTAALIQTSPVPVTVVP